MSDTTRKEIEALKAADPNRTGDTLEDLQSRDYDNFEHILRHDGVEHYFGDIGTCSRAMGACLSFALRKVGVDMALILRTQLKAVPPKLHARLLENRVPKMVQRVMDAQGVKVERRSYEVPSDRWKNGLYVFKCGEIAYIISDSRTYKTAVDPSMRYSFRTNVPVQDDRDKIMSIPSPEFIKNYGQVRAPAPVLGIARDVRVGV